MCHRIDSLHCQCHPSQDKHEQVSNFDRRQYKDNLLLCGLQDRSQHKADHFQLVEDESQCNSGHPQCNSHHPQCNSDLPQCSGDLCQPKTMQSHDTNGESHHKIDHFHSLFGRLHQHKNGHRNDQCGQEGQWPSHRGEHESKLTIHVPELRMAQPRRNSVPNDLGMQHLSEGRKREEHGPTRVLGATSDSSGITYGVAVTESMVRSFVLLALRVLNGWVTTVGKSRRHRMRVAIAGWPMRVHPHIYTHTSPPPPQLG